MKTIIHESSAALAQTLAASIATDLRAATMPFLILPGGRSPLALMEVLKAQDLNWENIVVSTSDERCVPLTDEHSNAGQIQKTMGLKAHSLLDGADDLPFPATVTVLGMGADGHFASLFRMEDFEKEECVVNATASSHPKERVSLSFETLLQTDRLILLVADEEKWRVCEAAINGDEPNLPIARLFEKAGDKLELHIVGASE